jgi:hypothetical protein
LLEKLGLAKDVVRPRAWRQEAEGEALQHRAAG